MKTILILHPISPGLADGVTSYCKLLCELFHNDNDIHIPDIVEIPTYDNRVFRNFYKWGELWRLVSDEAIDIVNVHGFARIQLPQLLLVTTLCRKKLVYTPHWHPYSTLRHPATAYLFAAICILPFIKHYAKCCITWNNEDSAYWKQYCSHVVRIPQWMRVLPPTTTYATAQDKKIIMFVGRFNAANKGIDYLWELPQGKYDIHLVGSGDITLRDDMYAHRNISFDELFQLYRQASLVVIPSLYESFSYVALEALSVGTPILISDKVRIADYLSNIDGCTIFNYGDRQAFLNMIEPAMKRKVDTTEIYCIFSKSSAYKLYKKVFLSI